MIIVLILISIAAFYGGYKFGKWFSAEQTKSLASHISVLRDQSDYLSHEAQGRYNLSNQVAQQQADNTASAIQTVIHLLQMIEHQQGANQNLEEQKKITQLISEARSITSP